MVSKWFAPQEVMTRPAHMTEMAKKARILPLLKLIWNAQFEQIAQKIAKYSLLQIFEWIHCLA